MAKNTKGLIPFKKGKSGNPNGRPPLDPVQKELRKLTLSVYKEIIEVALTGDLNALKALSEDTSLPAIKVGVARAILKACRDGDSAVLDRFAARIVGEIPKVLKVDGGVDVNHEVKVIPPTIARQALKEIEDDC